MTDKGRTVPELFDRIARLIRSPDCGPNGCARDADLVPDVRYDGSLGYPSSAGVVIGGREYRPATSEIPTFCTAAAHADFIKVSVEPLP